MTARRKPYTPGRDPLPKSMLAPGQLGVPNAFRRQHSEFDVEQLATGVDHQGGVIRSTVTSIITLPETRAAMIAEAIAALNAKGTFDVDVNSLSFKETPTDRDLTSVEHDALSWYLKINHIVIRGNANITNYSGSPRSEPGGKLAYSEREGNDRALHADVKELLPEAYLSFLDWLTWWEYPGIRDGTPPSEMHIAGQIVSSKDARGLGFARRGFTRAVAIAVAHAYGEARIRSKRRADRIALDGKKNKSY